MKQQETDSISNLLNEIEEGSFEHECGNFIFQAQQLIERENKENRYDKFTECFHVAKQWESEIKNKLIEDLTISENKLMILNYFLKNLEELKKNLKFWIKELGDIRLSHQSDLKMENESFEFNNDHENYDEDEERDYDFDENTEHGSDIKEFTNDSALRDFTNDSKISPDRVPDENNIEVEEKQELKIGDNLSPEILKKLYRKKDDYFKRLDTGDLIKLNTHVNIIENFNGNKKIITKIITLSLPSVKKHEPINIKKSSSQNGKLDNELSLKEFKKQYTNNKDEYHNIICSNTESEQNITRQGSKTSEKDLSLNNNVMVNGNGNGKINPSNRISKDLHDSSVQKNNSNNNSGFQDMKIPFQSTQEFENQTKNSKTSSYYKDSITNMIIQTNKMNLENISDNERISEKITPNSEKLHNEASDNSDTRKNFYKKKNDFIVEDDSQLENEQNIQTEEKFYPQKNNSENSQVNHTNTDHVTKPNSSNKNDSNKIIEQRKNTPAINSNNLNKDVMINIEDLIKNNTISSITKKDSDSHKEFRKINKTIDLQVEDVLDVDKNDLKQSNDIKPKVPEKTKIQSFSDLVKENCDKKNIVKKESISNEIQNQNDFESNNNTNEQPNEPKKRRIIQIENRKHSQNNKMEPSQSLKQEPVVTHIISPIESSLAQSKEPKAEIDLPLIFTRYILPMIPFIHKQYRWVSDKSKNLKVIDCNLNSQFNSNLRSMPQSNNIQNLISSMKEVPKDLYNKHIVAPLGFENRVINLLNAYKNQHILNEVSIWSHENEVFFDELLKLWKYSDNFSNHFNPVECFMDVKGQTYKIKDEFEEELNESSINIEVENQENFSKNFKTEFFMFNGKRLNLFPFYSMECNKDIHLTNDMNGHFDIKNKNNNNQSILISKLSLPMKPETNFNEEEESYIAMKNKSSGQLKPFFLNDLEIVKNNKKFCVYTSDDAEFRLIEGNRYTCPKVLWFKTNLLINLREKLTKEEFSRFILHWNNEICKNKKSNNMQDELSTDGSDQIKKLFFQIPFAPNSFKPGIKLFASKCGEMRILSASQHKGKKSLWIQVSSLNYSPQNSNKQDNFTFNGDDGSLFYLDPNYSLGNNKNIKLFKNENIKCLMDSNRIMTYQTNNYKIETLSEIRNKLSNNSNLKSLNQKLSTLKKSSLRKFLMVRGNLFLSLPFLKVYSSSDGQTKIIDGRSKYLNQTEYFLREEEPPLVQSPQNFSSSLYKQTILIKDPFVDQLGFKKYQILHESCSQNDSYKRVESVEGDKRVVVLENLNDLKNIWLSYNTEWNYSKPNYFMDDRGNKIEEVGHEISLRDLVDVGEVQQIAQQNNHGFHSKESNKFILDRYPYFMFFYNPSLKFIQTASGVKIINSNMYSVDASTPTISSNKDEHNQIRNAEYNIVPQEQRFKRPSEIPYVRTDQNEQKVFSNRNPSETSNLNNNIQRSVVNRNQISSEQNPPRLSYRNQFNSGTKHVSPVHDYSKSNKKLNTDYFGEYEQSNDLKRSKPLRYSSKGVSVSRPSYTSDTLGSSRGIKILTGQAAIKALRASLHNSNNNNQKNSGHKQYNSTTNEYMNLINDNRPKYNEPQIKQSRYISQSPLIDNKDKSPNARIENSNKLNLVKKSYSSNKKPEPIYFNRKKETIINKATQNLPVFSSNTNSKMISFGTLLNNIAKKSPRYMDNKSNYSKKTSSSIGHSVSIRSRSRSKIQNKSQQNFIPIDEYYQNLSNMSRSIRESSMHNQSQEVIKIEGLKGKLNKLIHSRKNLIRKDPSNEYFIRNSQPRNVNVNSISKKFNSLEPTHRSTNNKNVKKIRNIHHDEYSSEFMQNNAVINKKTNYHKLTKSYLIKKNPEEKTKQFRSSLVDDKAPNYQLNNDFVVRSKNYYDEPSIKDSSMDAHKKEEVGNQVFSNKYFQNHKKSHTNFNDSTNYQDQRFIYNNSQSRNVNVGSAYQFTRNNRFEQRDDDEGDFQEELIIGDNVKKFKTEEYNPYMDEEEELGPRKNQKPKNSNLNGKEIVHEDILQLNNYRVGQNGEYNMYEDEEEELGRRNNQKPKPYKTNDKEIVYEDVLQLNNYRVGQNGEYNMYEDEEEELGRRNNQKPKQYKTNDKEIVHKDILQLNNYRADQNGGYNMYEDEEEELGPNNKQKLKNSNSNDKEIVHEDILQLNNYRAGQNGEYNMYEDEEEELGPKQPQPDSNKFQSVKNSFEPYQQRNINNTISSNQQQTDEYGSFQQSIKNSFVPNLSERNNQYFSIKTREPSSSKFQSMPVCKPIRINSGENTTISNSNQRKYTGSNHIRNSGGSGIREMNRYNTRSTQNSDPMQSNFTFQTLSNLPGQSNFSFKNNKSNVPGQSNFTFQNNVSNGPGQSNFSFGQQRSNIPGQSNMTFGSSSIINRNNNLQFSHQVSEKEEGISNANNSNGWNFVGSSTSFKNESNRRDNSPHLSTSPYFAPPITMNQQNSGGAQIRRYPSRKIKVSTYSPYKAQIFEKSAQKESSNRIYLNSTRKN